MKTLTLEAPAKINLTLDILGRRTDGYHDMRMVMQAVSLGDTVTVAEAPIMTIFPRLRPASRKSSFDSFPAFFAMR